MKIIMAPGWDAKIRYIKDKGSSEITLLRVNDDRAFTHARFIIAHYPKQNPLELLVPLAPYAFISSIDEE
jgi:hypothetical protein